MHFNFRRTQGGFTLVELLVVMLVLVALSSITLDFTKDFAFQGRYEVTKDRYDKIKRAIIGRPDVLINGQPDISGFVADVGRLPNNLHELLEERFCLHRWRMVLGVKNYYDDEAECTGAGLSWSATISGWSGPYLTVKNNPLHDNAFPDGWGNQDSSESSFCSDLAYSTKLTCEGASPPETWFEGAAGHNYGWKVQYLTTAGVVTTTESTYAQMIIQSKGKNGMISATDTNYDADYPLAATLPSIRYTDWTVDVDNITVNIMVPNNGGCNADVCSNPAYDSSSCGSTKKATWIIGNCTDVGGNLISHTLASCTSPLIWEVAGTCSDAGFTTKSSCELANTWTSIPTCSDSAYTTEALCTAFVGTLITGCSNTTYTTKSSCETNSETWTSTASEFNCKKGGGNWEADNKNICIKINDAIYSDATINENGVLQTISFSGFKKVSDDSVVLSIISQGYYDVGLYEYDGSASTKCTSNLYLTGANRHNYFIPNSSLPTISW